jgi:hypothetical protein
VYDRLVNGQHLLRAYDSHIDLRSPDDYPAEGEESKPLGKLDYYDDFDILEKVLLVSRLLTINIDLDYPNREYK